MMYNINKLYELFFGFDPGTAPIALQVIRKFSVFNYSIISSPPKKGVKKPKVFIFFTSYWIKFMYGYAHKYMYICKSSILILKRNISLNKGL